ncbi:MAG: hypothetical protein NZM28_02380 [Fimbriimonadales bacterium]|nr:hypothetical protein [Fimbriimonadales bacterium]
MKRGCHAELRQRARLHKEPDYALERLARAQMEAGALDHALTTAEQITNPHKRLELVGQAISKHAQARNDARALEIAQSINDLDARADALCSIAEAQIQAGRQDAAVETLNRVPPLLRGVSWKQDVLRRLGALYTRAGQRLKACDLADQRERPEDRFWLYIGIAEGALGRTE